MISTVLILFLFLCLIFRHIYRKNDVSDVEFDKIPGPQGLPVIGNAEDLFCTAEERWRRVRARSIQYYPIYKMKVLGKKIVFLLDPVDLEAFLSDPKYIYKGPVYEPALEWLGNGLILSTGETWRKSRKMLTKSFHFGALKNDFESFHDTCDSLISLFESESGKPLDLFSFCSLHTLKIACETLFGKRIDMRDNTLKEVIKSIKDMTLITSIRTTVPLMNFLYKFTHWKKKKDQAMKIYNSFVTDIIENNRLNMEDGDHSRLTNILMGHFDDAVVTNELSNFLFAGQDTTSIALAFYLYILANKPQFQEEIHKEIIQTCVNEKPTFAEVKQMNFLDRFLRECFRLYPVVTFIARTLELPFSTPSGYTLPAGTNIFVQIFDVHRNPEIYPNPEIFDPDRFLFDNVQKRHPFSFIPFSAGPRNCIAQKFAILEIKTTVCGIVRKYKMEALGSLEDIVLTQDLFLKSKSPLKVKFIPR